MRRALALVAATCMLLVSALAAAHPRSTSFAVWRVDDAGAAVTFTLAPIEDQALGIAAQSQGTTTGERLQQRVWLEASGERCTAQPGVERLDESSRVVYRWRVACDAGPPWRVGSDAVFDVVAAHVHLASVTTPDGATTSFALGTGLRASPPIDAAGATQQARWPVYAWLGLEHIAGGWDHLMFVLVLMLGARTLGHAAGTVTGFTAGHSLTLGAAALGYVQVDSVRVESLVALSIAAAAATAVGGERDPSRRWPAVLALVLVGLAVVLTPGQAVGAVGVAGVLLFASSDLLRPQADVQGAREVWARFGFAALFGLLHGLAFAGALGELGLPDGERVAALAAFNVGVEAGQLAVVALAWPLMALARRREWAWPPALVAAAAGAVGCWAYVGRALG